MRQPQSRPPADELHTANTHSAPSKSRRGRDIGTDESTLLRLAREWRERAKQLRDWAAADGSAKAYECAADELESEVQRAADDVLTLSQASYESGYSVDHLARMIREGRIANAGRPNAPRIRRADVPRKAGSSLNSDTPPRISRAQIARSVVSQFRQESDA